MTQFAGYPAPVVDSPLPQTPTGFNPPVVAGNQPNTDVPPFSFEPGPAAPAVEPVDEVAQLAKSLNLDVTGFSTPEDARRAVQLVVERYAATGFASPQAPFEPQVPAAPTGNQYAQAQAAQQLQRQQPAVRGEVDDDFDSAITDPKVLKKIKELNSRLAEAEAQAQRVAQEQAAQQEQAYQVQIAELDRRTEQAIDRMASSKYGVGPQASFSQRVSRENLKRLAGSIILGMQQVPGQRIPVVEQIIGLAAFYDNGGQSPVQQPPNPYAEQQFVPPNVQVGPPRPGVPQYTAPPRRTAPTTEKEFYTKDDAYMQGARAILQRHPR